MSLEETSNSEEKRTLGEKLNICGKFSVIVGALFVKDIGHIWGYMFETTGIGIMAYNSFAENATPENLLSGMGIYVGGRILNHTRQNLKRNKRIREDMNIYTSGLQRRIKALEEKIDKEESSKQEEPYSIKMEL